MIANPLLPVIISAECTACGLCVDVCPENALVIENQMVSVLAGAECEYCGECEAVCPTEAIACPYDIIIEQAT